jgi:KDO2-lipid IV(A) lauroyltransferase
MRRAHHALAFLLGSGLYAGLQRMPLWSIQPVARILGEVSYPFARPVIARGSLQNLALALPEIGTRAERKRLMKRAFLKQVLCMFEMLAFSRSRELVAARHSNWEQAYGELERVRKQAGGLVLLTGHVGSWELLGLLISSHFPTVLVGKRTRNEPVNRLWSRIRGGLGATIVLHDESPRTLLRALREGGVVGIVGDHAFRRVSAMDVPYFGYPAKMPAAPITLARSAGLPLVFIFSIREKDGYRVMSSEPIHVSRSSDREQDVRGVLGQWTAFLEKTIREHPDNWLPLSRHWKGLEAARPETPG